MRRQRPISSRNATPCHAMPRHVTPRRRATARVGACRRVGGITPDERRRAADGDITTSEGPGHRIGRTVISPIFSERGDRRVARFSLGIVLLVDFDFDRWFDSVLGWDISIEVAAKASVETSWGSNRTTRPTRRAVALALALARPCGDGATGTPNASKGPSSFRLLRSTVVLRGGERTSANENRRTRDRERPIAPGG